MDYHNVESSEMWDWENQDYCLQDNTVVSKSLWNSVSETTEDLSYMFEESTPIKDCGELAHQVSHHEDLNSKGVEQCKEYSSQAKRRRMLQFDNEVVEINPLCDEVMPSSFLKSKERDDSFEDAFCDVSQWVAGFTDDSTASGSGYEGLDQSSEGWLADCFQNDNEIHLSPDDMNVSGSSDVIDITDICSSQPEYEVRRVEERPTPTRRNIIFRGRKSYLKTPTKLAAFVVYPFAFVKPCGMQGAVTLKDINQRILTPPPLKSKKNQEDPEAFPTSAFSGKPVVVKTKIRTEGGKGSITIMRTKG